MKITSFPFLLIVLAFAGFVNAEYTSCDDGYGFIDYSLCDYESGMEECSCVPPPPARERELQGIRKGHNTMKLREAHDEAVENANIASHQHRRALKEGKSSKACTGDTTAICVPKTGKSGKNADVPSYPDPS